MQMETKLLYSAHFGAGRYAQYLLLTFFVMFGLYLPQPLTPNYLQNLRGVGLVVMGQLISMRSLGVVAFNIVLGHFNARLGYLLAQVCMGLFAALIWLGAGLPAYMAGYLLMGSYITARGLVLAQGRTLVHAPNMGIAYGSLETVMSLAIVLGPPLAGYLYSINPNLIYSTSLALIGAGSGRQSGILSTAPGVTCPNLKKGKKQNGCNPELWH